MKNRKLYALGILAMGFVMQLGLSCIPNISNSDGLLPWFIPQT